MRDYRDTKDDNSYAIVICWFNQNVAHNHK